MTVYPRAQFERAQWLDLDGEWSCQFDFSGSGTERDLASSSGFSGKIRVPFCPESRLSGVGFTDFIEHMWYHRKITVPSDWSSSRVILHFGGVDYRCEAFLDGVSVGSHTGLDSFEFSFAAAPGSTHDLVLRVDDEIRSHLQPFGKQSPWFSSRGCSYTRTTGIHQSVWMEPEPRFGLRRCRIVPDFDAGAFAFIPEFFRTGRGNSIRISIADGGKEVWRGTFPAGSGVPIRAELADPKAWEPGNPFLYDLSFEVISAAGEVVDRVTSYAGLRKIHIEGDRFYLNNKAIFLRFVLDQGFYPEGIWTAPDDDAIRRDIELSLAAGFNGARLHQKIFSERFHYWADRLGYLTWAEFPDWGIGFWRHFTKKETDFNRSFRDYFAQWRSVVERDVNHPSIIAWTPFNESCAALDWDEHRRLLADIYDLTGMLDPTRPVNDSSGYVHAKTDIWSVHCYKQNAKDLREQLAATPIFMNFPEFDRGYDGQPFVVDEYGGVRYVPVELRSQAAANAWGYSNSDTAREAESRIGELTRVLVEDARCAGYCYTQLTDIEQEQNGIYNYDRSAKFDMNFIRAVFSAKPDWSR